MPTRGKKNGRQRTRRLGVLGCKYALLRSPTGRRPTADASAHAQRRQTADATHAHSADVTTAQALSRADTTGASSATTMSTNPCHTVIVYRPPTYPLFITPSLGQRASAPAVELTSKSLQTGEALDYDFYHFLNSTFLRNARYSIWTDLPRAQSFSVFDHLMPQAALKCCAHTLIDNWTLEHWDSVTPLRVYSGSEWPPFVLGPRNRFNPAGWRSGWGQ
ncbi:hypothetical protein DFH09DRAFT_1097864 [Mycena vulgaris]|nr:hypothetical protein DFH09DRAFT_1097864 [Mycena vulgaris]